MKTRNHNSVREIPAEKKELKDGSYKTERKKNLGILYILSVKRVLFKQIDTTR